MCFQQPSLLRSANLDSSVRCDGVAAAIGGRVCRGVRAVIDSARTDKDSRFLVVVLVTAVLLWRIIQSDNRNAPGRLRYTEFPRNIIRR